jgi:hypothetical protein
MEDALGTRRWVGEASNKQIRNDNAFSNEWIEATETNNAL